MAAPGAVAATGGNLKVAYYDQWSIYQNAFYLKDVDQSGEADNLDYLIYDFENINPTTLQCFETTKATDPDPAGENDPNAGDGAEDAFADYQKSFGADISVDGTADAYNDPIVGNFHQLQELKAKHPNLKVLLSLGGWTYSKYFSDAAATLASRKALVSSCINMFIKGNLPKEGGYGGPGTAAGIFDGFDIDWEYPGNAGGHLGNHYSAADKQNFTLLLKQFRTQLDAYGKANNRTMYLSAALSAGQDKIVDYQTNKIGQYLDFADLMSYDMHGSFDGNAHTNFQDPLFESPNDPSNPVPPGNQHYTINNAVQAWTVGDPSYNIPGGFPASKLTLGVPFYYRGWTGVTAGDNHGLYQPATGPSAPHALSGNVPGIAMYKEVTNIVNNPADTFWDPVSQSAWFYDGTTFYGGEDAQSLKAQADYAHCNGLAGFMLFSLYDMNPSDIHLFTDAVNDINGTTSSCPTGPPPPTGTPTPPPTQSPTPPPTGTPTPTPSQSPTPTPTQSPSQPPSGSCTAPAWDSSAVYTGGDEVSYGGHTWQAKWWTQGQEPGTTGQWGVWKDLGACSGGGGAPTPTPTQGTPTPTPTPTQSPTPTPTRSATPTPTPTSTSGIPAWAPNTAYTAGELVTYDGVVYKCRQSHTSLPGWTPAAVPALWAAQ